MNILSSTATFTRPADTTPYTANDLVANSVTAGSVVPMTFTVGHSNGFELNRVLLSTSNAANTNAKFNLHLYGSLPTVTNGDNGAWLSTASNWLGVIAIDSTGQTFSDISIGMSTLTTFPMILMARPIYGLLQATAAYTPASAQTFTVKLIGKSYL